MLVGAGNNPQCAILLAAGIEVKAHGEHVFEHCRWGLNMEHVGLYRPGAESFDFDFVLNGYRDILMPRHLPIRSGNLVE
ncbi:MAG: hypothetical protein M3O31_00095 [Acidobacteriota bacterium]|nr:hypothetical protein [Acidobacteriota bacterium]